MKVLEPLCNMSILYTWYLCNGIWVYNRLKNCFHSRSINQDSFSTWISHWHPEQSTAGCVGFFVGRLQLLMLANTKCLSARVCHALLLSLGKDPVGLTASMICVCTLSWAGEQAAVLPFVTNVFVVSLEMFCRHPNSHTDLAGWKQMDPATWGPSLKERMQILNNCSLRLGYISSFKTC